MKTLTNAILATIHWVFVFGCPVYFVACLVTDFRTPTYDRLFGDEV